MNTPSSLDSINAPPACCRSVHSKTCVYVYMCVRTYTCMYALPACWSVYVHKCLYLCAYIIVWMPVIKWYALDHCNTGIHVHRNTHTHTHIPIFIHTQIVSPMHIYKLYLRKYANYRLDDFPFCGLCGTSYMFAHIHTEACVYQSYMSTHTRT